MFIIEYVRGSAFFHSLCSALFKTVFLANSIMRRLIMLEGRASVYYVK